MWSGNYFILNCGVLSTFVRQYRSSQINVLLFVITINFFLLDIVINVSFDSFSTIRLQKDSLCKFLSVIGIWRLHKQGKPKKILQWISRFDLTDSIGRASWTKLWFIYFIRRTLTYVSGNTCLFLGLYHFWHSYEWNIVKYI